MCYSTNRPDNNNTQLYPYSLTHLYVLTASDLCESSVLDQNMLIRKGDVSLISLLLGQA